MKYSKKRQDTILSIAFALMVIGSVLTWVI